MLRLRPADDSGRRLLQSRKPLVADDAEVCVSAGDRGGGGRLPGPAWFKAAGKTPTIKPASAGAGGKHFPGSWAVPTAAWWRG